MPRKRTVDPLIESISRYTRGARKQFVIRKFTGKDGTYYTVKNLRDEEWGVARVPEKDFKKFTEVLNKSRNPQREFKSLHRFTEAGRTERNLNMVINLRTALHNWYAIDAKTEEYIIDALNNMDLAELDRFISGHRKIWDDFWDNYDAIVETQKHLTYDEEEGAFYDDEGNRIDEIQGARSEVDDLLILLQNYINGGKRRRRR